jgi:uncharacterized DUF497 family protein
MNYTWDPEKAKKNLWKHGIRFADVEPVFEDERAIETDDHSSGEERTVIVGMDALARIVVVVFVKGEDEFRILSARKAEPRERRLYNG